MQKQKIIFSSSIITKALNIIFPKKCAVCEVYFTEGDRKQICNNCWGKISFLGSSFCSVCSTPFSSGADMPETYVCGKCRKHPPHFDKTLSFTVYEGVIKTLIHQYKYKNKPGVAEDLIFLIDNINNQKNREISADYIIHVPIHKNSLLDRGFDQSYILAQKISAKFNIPFIFNNLIRIKKTSQQVSLTKKARIKNIKGAFLVKRPEELKEKSVILVDDVLTTGATANECSRLLKKAGVSNILILTMARTA